MPPKFSKVTVNIQGVYDPDKIVGKVRRALIDAKADYDAGDFNAQTDFYQVSYMDVRKNLAKWVHIVS